MQNIKQFVKERQEIIKPLQTCESYFLTPKKICGVSVIRIALQKTVQVDTTIHSSTSTKCCPDEHSTITEDENNTTFQSTSK